MIYDRLPSARGIQQRLRFAGAGRVARLRPRGARRGVWAERTRRAWPGALVRLAPLDALATLAREPERRLNVGTGMVAQSESNSRFLSCFFVSWTHFAASVSWVIATSPHSVPDIPLFALKVGSRGHPAVVSMRRAALGPSTWHWVSPMSDFSRRNWDFGDTLRGLREVRGQREVGDQPGARIRMLCSPIRPGLAALWLKPASITASTPRAPAEPAPPPTHPHPSSLQNQPCQRPTHIPRPCRTSPTIYPPASLFLA